MSFGRSTISPTPTMTGMRSSGRGEVRHFFLFLFLDYSDLILMSRVERRLEAMATAHVPAMSKHRREERFALLALTRD